MTGRWVVVVFAMVCALLVAAVVVEGVALSADRHAIDTLNQRAPVAGPQGPAGPRGEPGPAGPPGPAGASGAAMQIDTSQVASRPALDRVCNALVNSLVATDNWVVKVAVAEGAQTIFFPDLRYLCAGAQ